MMTRGDMLPSGNPSGLENPKEEALNAERRLSNMIHDLESLLVSISLCAQLPLNKNNLAPGSTEKVLETIVEESQHARGVVKRMARIVPPLPREKNSEREASEEGSVGLRSGETILVVEDAGRFRHAVRAGLEAAGYQTLGAANGCEALTILAKNEVDVVLTDINMPRMGGEELLCNLQARHPNLDVIAMTGHSTADDVRELRGAGFAEAIPKPFSIEKLVQVIRDVQAHAT